MLVPFIWSCFCLFAHLCFIHIFFLYIFTHCCFDNAKKIKKLVPYFCFQNYFWRYAGVWCEMTDTYFMNVFGWYSDYHSPLKQKLKRDLCFLFTMSQCLEVVWKITFYIGWVELKLSSGPPYLSLKVSLLCIQQTSC